MDNRVVCEKSALRVPKFNNAHFCEVFHMSSITRSQSDATVYVVRMTDKPAFRPSLVGT